MSEGKRVVSRKQWTGKKYVKRAASRERWAGEKDLTQSRKGTKKKKATSNEQRVMSVQVSVFIVTTSPVQSIRSRAQCNPG